MRNRKSQRVALSVLSATLLCSPTFVLAQTSTDASSSFQKIRAMIPMRDGVRLNTEIYVPQGRSERLPFLITRTSTRGTALPNPYCFSA